MSDNRAIGVFDSGVGGLTVYRALRDLLPQEDFVYLGDTARLPYGTKSAETVTQYALQAARLLIQEDIKLLVVACNTASASALPSLRKALPDLPCLGVVEAGAQAAVKASGSGKVVVMATEGTVRSGAYLTAIRRHCPNAEVYGLACNLLVGMVEEGWCEGPEAEIVVSRFLKQLENVAFDTVVLGCTHFPLMAKTIEKLLPMGVKVIDSAVTTAHAVKDFLRESGIAKSRGGYGNDRFLVTDAPERFLLAAEKFVSGLNIYEVEQVNLSSMDTSTRKHVHLAKWSPCKNGETKMNSKSYIDFFKDKTVTLLGLGLLGRGVGDAAFLARHCKKVFVTDMKTADELRVSVDALKEYRNIEFFLGGHDEKLFSSVDFVIKGAGVRLDNQYVAVAQKNNIPVYMSTALFTQFAPIKTIGVTGTRGKTSTTCMIAEILKAAGKKVLLGGNIRGVSTLALLGEADQYDVAVLELDSWQLQGFDDLKISPDISVFTTFYPDHMNYYDGDMQRYLHDKTAVFRHQKQGDVFVTTAEVADQIWQDREGHKGDFVVAKPLSEDFKLKIPGVHNLLNGGLAKAAGVSFGIDEKTVDAALHDFAGVEGRLQYVGSWQDRNIYNDNNSTTQEATLAALVSFPAPSVVLIFGGADKGLPLDKMLDYISANNIRCVLIKGSGSDRVLQKMPDVPVVSSMPDAIGMAKGLSKPHDNIILSPAFASFGVFKNEYDRNDQFMAEVRKMTAGG